MIKHGKLNLLVSDDELFREFVQFTKSIFPTETSEYKSKTVFGDLTNPHLEFPLARQMKVSFLFLILLYDYYISL